MMHTIKANIRLFYFSEFIFAILYYFKHFNKVFLLKSYLPNLSNLS